MRDDIKRRPYSDWGFSYQQDIADAVDEIDRLGILLSRERWKILEASKYILFLAEICDGAIPSDATYADWREEHSLVELMSES
jgi:hypothetical protein